MLVSRRAISWLLAVVCVSLLPTLPSAAAEAKDYAYLFLQGRLTDGRDSKPLGGATVRLIGEDAVHESVTDNRGSFIFDKLPLEAFDLEIILADGRVLQGYHTDDAPNPSQRRVRMKKRKGERASIHIEATRTEVAFDVPERGVNRGKLWAELGIVLGVALLLAL